MDDKYQFLKGPSVLSNLFCRVFGHSWGPLQYEIAYIFSMPDRKSTLQCTTSRLRAISSVCSGCAGCSVQIMPSPALEATTVLKAIGLFERDHKPFTDELEFLE